MKKLLILTIAVILGTVLFGATGFAQQKVQADYYWGIGCAHCAKVVAYLDEHPEVLTRVNLNKYEVYQDRANAQKFTALNNQLGIAPQQQGVPMLFSGDEHFLGDKDIIAFFSQFEDKVPVIDPSVIDPVDPEPIEGGNALTWPVLLTAALLDSVNPCEFAILILLLATILAADGKRRALFSGLAFSLSIFISYYLMGLGLYSAVANANISSILLQVIGVVAIIMGLINLKDFFWYGQGFSLEIPASWKPIVKRLIKSITSPLGAFFVGFVISLFLLPCTSGPYIVVLGMLGQNETYWQALWMLLIYNLIFIVPMLAIVLAIYFGLDIKKAEAQRRKQVRLLHLITGLLMIGLGVLMLGGWV